MSIGKVEQARGQERLDDAFGEVSAGPLPLPQARSWILHGSRKLQEEQMRRRSAPVSTREV
jgi:hypothetical protein